MSAQPPVIPATSTPIKTRQRFVIIDPSCACDHGYLAGFPIAGYRRLPMESPDATDFLRPLMKAELRNRVDLNGSNRRKEKPGLHRDRARSAS
jgi:hypothetical protein